MSRDSLSTTSPCAGSSSTFSATPRVRVPRNVARLVVDYFTSRRLVVDYFAYAARPGASERRAARRRLLHLAQARRRLIRLHHASGCLCTSCDLSRGSSSTILTMLCVRMPWHVARLVAPFVVNFDYATRPGAMARRAAHRAARRRLLRLRRASGCLGSSRGLSRRSSSTTSPTLCVRVPQHVPRLVVSFFA
jgi:hypothetical protein